MHIQPPIKIQYQSAHIRYYVQVQRPPFTKTKEEVLKMITHYQGVRKTQDLIPLGQVGVCAKIGLFLVMLVITSLGVFSNIRLAVINKIIYFKTHTTSDRRIVYLFKDNHV